LSKEERLDGGEINDLVEKEQEDDKVKENKSKRNGTTKEILRFMTFYF